MPAPKGNKYGKNQGRETEYTPEIAKEICTRISCSSTSLKNICKELKIGYSNTRKWLIENEDFRNLYARAKELQADHMADEIHDTAEEAIKMAKKGVNSFRLGPFVQAMRLKVDSLKWTAAKLKPRSYGDRLDVTSDGEKLEAVQIVMPSNARETKK